MGFGSFLIGLCGTVGGFTGGKITGWAINAIQDLFW